MFSVEAIEKLSQAEAITAAGNAIASSMIHDVELDRAIGVVALPNTFDLHDVEKYLPNRRHARGTMTTAYVDHFANYVEAHAEDGATVFVSDSIAAKAVLNLGRSIAPGHADNLAELAPTATAAYRAFRDALKRPMNQREAAEFIEDWAEYVHCVAGDSNHIPNSKAAAAFRKLTIETARKLTAEVQSLGESMSAFEQVQANSVEPIPEFIVFTCRPYADFEARAFTMRVGILTSDKPQISLRALRLEQHIEEMARGLADKVTEAIGDAATVVLGTYQRG